MRYLPLLGFAIGLWCRWRNKGQNDMRAQLDKQTIDLARRTSDGYIDHARGCKKTPSECIRCTQSIGYHASLPLDVLAVVLEDRPTLKQ